VTELTLMRVDSWTLATTGFEDGQPRVRDLELAEHLGYERPRKVRDLIRRLAEEGKLPAVYVRPTVGRTSMPNGGARVVQVNEYWLTEAQAHKVVAKSDTLIADAALDEMIQAFMSVRHGAVDVRGAVPAITFAQFQAMLAPLAAEIASLKKQVIEQYGGTISVTDCNALRREVRDIARLRAKGNLASKGENSERRIIYNKLGAAVSWTGTGRSWRALPAARVAEARAVLREMRTDALRLFPSDEERQLKLLPGGG
jgi:hypothetical protein